MYQYVKVIALFFCLSICTVTFAQTSKTKLWLDQNMPFVFEKLSANISPNDAAPGAVIASPSRSNPNYYYHWVRDAALVMDSLVDTYKTTNDKYIKQLIRQKMFEYLAFSTNIQNLNTQADLGEPKFNVDGSAFNYPWGRPQNDGPALRAISLIHWAQILIANGESDIVKQKMYANTLPANTPIKKDLEYVSHHWKDTSFDLWEEVKGEHFYTLMVQRKALLEGAELAAQLGDTGAAAWYDMQAKQISLELQNFWDANKGYFVATINRVGGLDNKYSNLDISVVLGLLHGDTQDKFISWSDAKVSATITALIQHFQAIYPINQRQEIPGVAIGRYPEDVYSGTNVFGGNPWPLCTLAIAESLYRVASALQQEGHLPQAKTISDLADQFVERVRYHANADGSLSEQMDKNTGYMTSARDLSWNYAALLTTRKSMLSEQERLPKRTST